MGHKKHEYSFPETHCDSFVLEWKNPAIVAATDEEAEKVVADLCGNNVDMAKALQPMLGRYYGHPAQSEEVDTPSFFQEHATFPKTQDDEDFKAYAVLFVMSDKGNSAWVVDCGFGVRPSKFLLNIRHPSERYLSWCDILDSKETGIFAMKYYPNKPLPLLIVPGELYLDCK